MRCSLVTALTAVAILGSAPAFAQQTRDAHPDLQGLWTNSTATPLQRPTAYAEKPKFTPEEALAWARGGVDRIQQSMPPADRLFASDVDVDFLETQNFHVLDDLRTSLI